MSSRYNHQQAAFSVGVLSTQALGREDLDKYKQAVKACYNFIIHPLGPLHRRGGSRYIASAVDATKNSRLIPFRFSTEDQYMLEFSENVIRFFRNQARVESGGSPYEVVTTYTDDEVASIWGAQSADVIYLAHKDHAPAKLVRTSHTSWALSSITFTATPAAWGAGNYPSLCWIHESRLYWAATPNEPNTFWGSRINDYEDHTTGSLATDGFAFTLVAENQPNKIQWVVSSNVFAMGTAGAEFVIVPPDAKAALSALNIKAHRYTGLGGYATPAVSIDAAALFIQKGKRKLRQMQYVFEKDRYEASDITLLSSGVLESGAEELSYVNDPHSMIWCRRADGRLVAMTYEPAHGIFGWHPHALAGTNAVVESIASIDGVIDENKDELWMVVSRTVNGATVKYIEVLDWGLVDEDDIEDAFFLDSGITYNYSPAQTSVNVAHLVGETVSLFTDGYKQEDKVVSAGGTITLDHAAETVNVGLDYTSYVDMLPIPVPSNAGSGRPLDKRAVSVHVRVLRTLGMKAGPDADNLSTYFFGPPASLDTAIPPVSDTIELPFDEESSYDAPIRIQSQGPLPLTILSVTAPVEIGA